MRLQEKHQAIELRKLGKSYKEIINEIPNLSKSTLSGWLKYIELTHEQSQRLEQRLTSKREKARWKASNTLKQKRIVRMEATIQEAQKEVTVLVKNPLFLFGLSLYWCEGSHKSNDFNFINSDPAIIKGMIKWLDEICGIPKEKLQLRLYIHEIYSGEDCIGFWSKQLHIPRSRFKLTYKPTPHIVKRNPDYKGCLRIRCGGVELFRRFIGWKNGTISYLQI